MTTPSPTILMPRTTLRITKAGRSAQNSVPGASASPGSRVSGRPNQAASMTRCMSYSPNGTEIAQPAAIPMGEVQILHVPRARSTMAAVTTSVTVATRGPATGEVPSGTSWNRSNARGRTETTISIRTVPETTGVTIRRKVGSHPARANWQTAATTVRVASMAGPPASRAINEMAMYDGVAHVMSRCPAPSRPTRPDCMAVASPPITRAAKTAHSRYESPCRAERTVTATITTVGASTRMTDCRATLNETRGGHLSSGS